jgi:energy-coupling factor transport system ATP-binding protein
MRLVLDRIRAERGAWSLAASGIFDEGVHLVTGAVGCGKTTLALILAGLFHSHEGYVERNRITSMMLSLQSPEFHVTGLSVDDECASWGLDTDTVLQSAHLAISEKVSPLSLSRGELKRLHLACVLSRQYDLLLLDEPFSSLDCDGKEQLSHELSSRHHGITILFTQEQTAFPRIDHLWEFSGSNLCDRGKVPEAIRRWQSAPPLIKRLIQKGVCPENLTADDIREAACRMLESG